MRAHALVLGAFAGLYLDISLNISTAYDLHYRKLALLWPSDANSIYPLNAVTVQL